MIEYNIEIREFNGVDYDALYPKTKIENVDGLQTTISQIYTDIGTINTKTSTNASNITQLSQQTNGEISSLKGRMSEAETDIGSINGDISSITGSLGEFQQSISNLSTNKQDKTGLGNLAFKDKVTLTNNEETEGILPIDKGGTGASSSSGALMNLGIIISNLPIVEGAELQSGLIYIYYQ